MINLLNKTSDSVLKHQKKFKEIEKAFEKLNNKISTVMTIQTVLFTVLIQSSPTIKDNLKMSLSLLQNQAADNENLMNHADFLLKLIDHSNDLKDGKKTFPFLDLIQGGKEEEE